jgi:hypothetical protein
MPLSIRANSSHRRLATMGRRHRRLATMGRVDDGMTTLQRYVFTHRLANL